MLPPLKHIIRLSLFVLLMGNLVSCQSWHDAKAVIAEADSLLANGLILRDTAVLARAIETLDKPITRKLAREELVKANYLMGRNLDDYHHNFADAADYYIAADRLKTKDLILRGRINSCMGYLCKQDSCFEEALIFYERANEAFAESGNERRYANGLLSIAEQYVNLREYDKADSVLTIAETYEIDSAYYARMVDVKALALFNQQKYGLALEYLLGIKDYPRNCDARCYSYKMIIQIYDTTDCLNEAYDYAKYIIHYSNNPSFRSNAYYVLINLSNKWGNINDLADFSYCREDNNSVLRHISESYAEASLGLRNYLRNPNPYRNRNIIIIITLLCLVVTIGIALYYIKNNKLTSQEANDWREQAQKMLQEKTLDFVERRKAVEHIVEKSILDFKTNQDVWKNDELLFQMADSYFAFLITRLRNIYHLHQQDLKICLMTLLQYSNKEIMNAIGRSTNSAGKLKKHPADIPGTTPSDLRDFLLDFMAK